MFYFRKTAHGRPEDAHFIPWYTDYELHVFPST